MLAPPTSKSTVLSPAQTLVDGRVPQKYSPARRYVLLLIFCLAQFLDAFNNSALFSAIPSLVISLGMSEAESTWIISAFQLTFASFLLIVSTPTVPAMGPQSYLLVQSGRISDVYNPSTCPSAPLGYPNYRSRHLQNLNSSVVSPSWESYLSVPAS